MASTVGGGVVDASVVLTEAKAGRKKTNQNQTTDHGRSDGSGGDEGRRTSGGEEGGIKGERFEVNTSSELFGIFSGVETPEEQAMIMFGNGGRRRARVLE